MGDVDQRRKLNVLKHKTNISDELPNYFKIKGVCINKDKFKKKQRRVEPLIHHGKFFIISNRYFKGMA